MPVDAAFVIIATRFAPAWNACHCSRFRSLAVAPLSDAAWRLVGRHTVFGGGTAAAAPATPSSSSCTAGWMPTWTPSALGATSMSTVVRPESSETFANPPSCRRMSSIGLRGRVWSSIREFSAVRCESVRWKSWVLMRRSTVSRGAETIASTSPSPEALARAEACRALASPVDQSEITGQRFRSSARFARRTAAGTLSAVSICLKKRWCALQNCALLTRF